MSHLAYLNREKRKREAAGRACRVARLKEKRIRQQMQYLIRDAVVMLKQYGMMEEEHPIPDMESIDLMDGLTIMPDKKRWQ